MTTGNLGRRLPLVARISNRNPDRWVAALGLDLSFYYGPRVAARRLVNGPGYAGVPLSDQVLLVIDTALCDQAGSPTRWEVLAADQPFPHIYGPIPADAVVATLPLHSDEAGLLVMPDLTGLEVVEHPPTDREPA